MTIQKSIADIIERYGNEILLDGNKFCSLLSDLAPECKLELRIIRRMSQEDILKEVYSILRHSDSDIKRFDVLLEEAGFSEEWKKIVLCVFSLLDPKNQSINNSKKFMKPTDNWEQYRLGFNFEFGLECDQDYKKAIYWYRKSSEQNNSWAQNRLGDLYSNGNGVNQDYKEAVKWYNLACANGDDTAQYNLGICYFKGLGVEQNYNIAFQHFMKSYEIGNSEAAKKLAPYYIGWCYEHGLGVERNLLHAYEWYKKLIKAGFLGVEIEIKRIEKKLSNISSNFQDE